MKKLLLLTKWLGKWSRVGLRPTVMAEKLFYFGGSKTHPTTEKLSVCRVGILAHRNANGVEWNKTLSGSLKKIMVIAIEAVRRSVAIS